LSLNLGIRGLIWPTLKIWAIVDYAFVTLFSDLSQVAWVNLTQGAKLSGMAGNRKAHQNPKK
jgi:hypothetical protein